MTRDGVIGRVSSRGFVGGYLEMYGDDKEAVARLEKQSEAEQDRILRAAFSLARYGMVADPPTTLVLPLPPAFQLGVLFSPRLSRRPRTGGVG